MVFKQQCITGISKCLRNTLIPTPTPAQPARPSGHEPAPLKHLDAPTVEWLRRRPGGWEGGWGGALAWCCFQQCMIYINNKPPPARAHTLSGMSRPSALTQLDAPTVAWTGETGQSAGGKEAKAHASVNSSSPVTAAMCLPPTCAARSLGIGCRGNSKTVTVTPPPATIDRPGAITVHEYPTHLCCQKPGHWLLGQWQDSHILCGKMLPRHAIVHTVQHRAAHQADTAHTPLTAL